MSEPRSEYLDDSPKCPNCKGVFGQYVQYNGKVMLLVGGVTMRQFYGYCGCGRQLNFHSSDKDLERLITRVRRLREEKT